MSPALGHAIVALRAGRAAEAERLAGDVLARGEDPSLAAKILGQALLIQGRADAAINPLRQAAGGDDDPELRILLGRALGDAGREAEALEVLNGVVTHRPLIPQAFLSLADYLWKLRSLEEAVALLEEGLKAAPDEVLLKIGLGYFHLKRQDHIKARALFSEAYSEAPTQHDALVGLATASALGGDFTLAAELYLRALGSRPNDATTQMNLGKCLLELGQREAGEAAIRRAARGARQLTPFVNALADTARGRLLVRPSAARQFLRAETP
jgi:tetratricopeptide (TPR) repeat protein